MEKGLAAIFTPSARTLEDSYQKHTGTALHCGISAMILAGSMTLGMIWLTSESAMVLVGQLSQWLFGMILVEFVIFLGLCGAAIYHKLKAAHILADLRNNYVTHNCRYISMTELS